MCHHSTYDDTQGIIYYEAAMQYQRQHILLNQVYTESIYTARTRQNVIAFRLQKFSDTEFSSNKMSRTDATTIIIIVLK